MRLILQSQVYQRSAQAIPGNADDSRFYCRYYPRRLMAEVLHDAIVTVTGVPTKFTEIEFQVPTNRPLRTTLKGRDRSSCETQQLPTTSSKPLVVINDALLATVNAAINQLSYKSCT